MTRTIQGERLCRSCGTNVHGAAIERETSYGLDVVRCPSCGDVDAVTTFPLEGNAGARWRTAIAAITVVLTFGVLLGGIGLGSMISTAATMESVDSVHWQIASHYREWYASRHPEQAADNFALAWEERDFDVWWAEHEVQAKPLIRSQVEVDEFAITLIPAAGLFLIGAVLSAAMATRGRWHVIRGWMLYAALTGVAFAIGWIDFAFRSPTFAEEVAWMYARLPYLTIALGLNVSMMFVGILAGPSLARGLVRLLLPPRRRAAFAPMWRAAGRVPPLHGRAST